MSLNRTLTATLLAGALAATPTAAPAEADRGSDLWKEASITTAIALNEQLNPFDIDVDVRNDVARLRGSVDSDVEKQLARRIAMAVDGVERVELELETADGSAAAASKERNGRNALASAIDDATITAKVKSQLLWNDRTNGYAIDVSSDDGVVTLTGKVGSREAVRAARRIALDTRGVRVVEHALQIDPSVQPVQRQAESLLDRLSQGARDRWIAAKVKSALLYNRNVDGTDIDVGVDTGTVTLSGTVSDADELERAVRLAEEVVGVRGINAALVVDDGAA